MPPSSYASNSNNRTRPRHSSRPQDEGKLTKSPYYRIVEDRFSNLTEVVLRNSDGDPSRLPPKQKTFRVVDEDGEVNYLEEANEKIEKHWRKVIGRFLAKEVLEKDGWRGRRDNCLLQSLPENYRLYTHKKGDKDIPRTDAYLFGGPHKFRSPEEFCLHARWLALGSPTKTFTNKPDCACVYCDKRYTQKQLNKMWGIVSATPARRGPRKKSDGSTTDWSNICAKDYTKLNTATQPSTVIPPTQQQPSSDTAAGDHEVFNPRPVLCNL
ncbi:hypothetical protein GLOTRDRAFT_110620 [Gloeophyllum trabeum ATCC 11539]|uniref:Cryptic loci regulator 2 N-terminal domain-containing protein n=1 Tax=Gloeophyllum trabeum (strain ATCC 11539 / FP-39264 / Madison 617) TaxID=670483 RepID=S7RSD6_GLOTA|nr:uncharacterized protein GLOTRDRAFT_110620 [Gloeophyllum trabeum ATCC 11539]EPQ57545.1 hypothetical protein GLOTRDRAFT_110620 [Gloeophyllum trabeum ATCC 11539]